eukprot:1470910-Rhodomonas_salina.1
MHRVWKVIERACAGSIGGCERACDDVAAGRGHRIASGVTGHSAGTRGQHGMCLRTKQKCGHTIETSGVQVLRRTSKASVGPGGSRDGVA